jgi:xanthine dehydrogenase accessory factor
MRDILPTLARWRADGRRAAIATVVERRGSAPRDPGASLALSDRGEIAGSVTGGCVEPAVLLEAEEVLAGASARIREYGITDDAALEVGLACGGTVAILIAELDLSLVPALDEAVAADRSVDLAVAVSGTALGTHRLLASPTAASGESGLARLDGETFFVHALRPRPALYVFGAIDHAAALTRVGKLLGYRVTVCDARAAFVTPERFPDADELVVEWPDRFLAEAPVDERTAICVLTHDQKFDVPALQAALRTPAGYIGAMGSRNTTDRRRAALVAEGATEDDLARIHAPIGLSLGGKTPEAVAISIGAEIVQVMSAAQPAQPAGAGRA